MSSFARRHTVLTLFIAIVGIAVLVMAAWVVAAGPATVSRILRYGDTDIDDFSHYPGRELRASKTPHAFKRGAELRVPATRLEAFGSGDLETILEANDSIAFLVVHDDAIVYERYFQGHTASSVSQTFSVTKSLFSVLVGMAIDDGYLQGVDQAVADFVPELADRGFDSVTLHHLLTMTSGSDYVENDNPFGEHVIMNYTPDLEAQILSFAVEDVPGEVFRYKSGDNALLALALDRALGDETITAYTQRRVWTPLGMEGRGVWTTDREGGLEKTWCCLATTARDLARFGRLYRNLGQWNGKRLLSPDWVTQSTLTRQVPEAAWPERFGDAGWRNYGYQWWLASTAEKDFFALGKDGQFLYVNPTRNVIIVRLGWSTGDSYGSEWVRLFQAIAATFDSVSPEA